MKKLGFILLLLWHLDLKAAAEAKEEKRDSWAPVGSVHHYAEFLELFIRKDGSSFIKALTKAHEENKTGHPKVAEKILEEELEKVIPMFHSMKSSIGLREEAFTILFDKESGAAFIPDNKEDLIKACGLLIESARLESHHSDTESTRWIEDLEEFSKIPIEESLVKMWEEGKQEEAKAQLAEIWTKVVNEGYV